MADTTAHKILVVDDEEPVRSLLTLILRAKGYSVRDAQDGNSALEALAREPVDLVITDMNMPGMDGLTLLRQVRQKYPDSDVIVLTGYGTIQSAVYAIKNGALDYISKPFDMVELEEKIASHMHARETLATARDESNGTAFEPLVELSRVLASQIDLSATIDQTIAILNRGFRPMGIRISILDEELEDGRLSVESGRCFRSELFAPLEAEQIRSLAPREPSWFSRQGEADGSRVYCFTVPLDAADEVLGALSIVRAEPVADSEARMLRVFGVQLGLAMLHGRTHQRMLEAFQDLQQLSLSAVETLFEALRTYDSYTHDHSERVSRFARALGEAAGIQSTELETLAIAALLHDVGKLGISDITLHKEDDLTVDEQDRIRLHPTMGARILRGLDVFADVVPLVLHHHERFDGQGYPDHLSDEEIPIGARIIAVVDAFDSMTSDRPYRRAMSVDKALQCLTNAADTQLDGALVNQWLRIVSSPEFARLPIAHPG